MLLRASALGKYGLVALEAAPPDPCLHSPQGHTDPRQPQPVTERDGAQDPGVGLMQGSLSGHSLATARNFPGAALLSVTFLPNFFLLPLLSHGSAPPSSFRSLPSVGISSANALHTYCCVTNCHKIGGLKQHTFIISQLVDQESRHGVISPLPQDLSQGCYHGGQGGALI